MQSYVQSKNCTLLQFPLFCDMHFTARSRLVTRTIISPWLRKLITGSSLPINILILLFIMRKISPGNSLKMYLIVHVKYLQCLNNSFNLEDIANKENKISERRVSNASLLDLFLNSRSSIFLSRRCKPSDPNVVQLFIFVKRLHFICCLSDESC